MATNRFLKYRIAAALLFLVVLAGAAQAGLAERVLRRLDLDEASQAIGEAQRSAVEAARSFGFEGRDARVGHQTGAVWTPGLDSMSVATPAIKIAEVCSLEQCYTDTTVSLSIATPRLDSVDASTEAIKVSEACSYLVCVGPFTIPAINLAKTPAVESVTLYREARVPAICAASGACLGEQIIATQEVSTPKNDSLRLIDGVAVEASVEGLSALVSSHAGEMWAFGPMRLEVPLAGVGTVPVTLCPNGCMMPALPDAQLAADVSLSLETQAATFATKFPVSFRF